MIKLLENHIDEVYPPMQTEIVDKINEIIRYLNKGVSDDDIVCPQCGSDRISFEGDFKASSGVWIYESRYYCRTCLYEFSMYHKATD